MQCDALCRRLGVIALICLPCSLPCNAAQADHDARCAQQAQDYAAMVAPPNGASLFNSVTNGIVTSGHKNMLAPQSQAPWQIGQERVDQKMAYRNAYRQAYENCLYRN
jgi:hypothetical protein